MKKCLLITLAVLSCAVLSSRVLAADKAVDCENALNTFEINQCASIALGSAEAELAKYLAASLAHHSDDPELVQAIKDAQTDWQAYLASHCNAVHTQWRHGSIRGVMAISCKTQLTKQRTHEVWQRFLTYMDSAPPVLPEPNL